MNTETVTLFLALLAVLAQLAVVGWLLLAGGSRLLPALVAPRERVRAEVAPHALTLAAVVASVATAGSLYLSEVAGFVPCELCWYQRIAMYPLVVVLGTAAIRRDASARLAAGILAGIGGAISVWHLAVERLPALESSSCDPTAPCSFRWVEEFGYLTIPGMALSGFALIGVLLVLARPGQ